MIDTQAIRNKVLDLAMRGQLTEQLLEDGTADELYQQIQEEKQILIKEGRIKKEKVQDETKTAQYNIPKNWKWVIFSSIITLQSGQDLKQEEYNSDKRGIPYLTGASNFDEKGQLIINRWTEYPKNIAIANDVLLSCKGTVGKLAILSVDRVHIARQFMAIRAYKSDVRFVMYYMQSIINNLKKVSKGLIPGIERNDVLKLQMPLPPSAEQKRIVEKLDQTFSTLDAIDELQSKYSDNRSVLKSKLIDAAIQGKLTEQLPEDGTAEEYIKALGVRKKRIEESGVLKGRKKKTILPIEQGEKPFEIPKTWNWIRLGSVVEIFGRIGFRGYTKNDIVNKGQGALSLSPSNITKEGQIVFDKNTYISWEKYEESPEIKVEEEDLLIVKTGSSYGKAAIIQSLPEKATINPQLAIMKYVLCDRYYLHYVLSSSMAYRQYEKFVVGAATPTFSQEDLANFVLPLPPLAEQMRIVAGLDEILKLIEI